MSAAKKKYSAIFRDGGAGRNAKMRFRRRRLKLMQEVDELMVLAGVPYGPGGETVWAYAHCPTYQEPTVMHLTGINQSEVILLLDPDHPESDEILFVGKKNPAKEFWDGVRLGVGDLESEKEATKVTGIQDVRDIESFDEVLLKRLGKRKNRKLGTFWHESEGKKKRTVRTDHNWFFKKRIDSLLKKQGSGHKSFNIMQDHYELRLPLDKYDVLNTAKAQKITGNAFVKTLKHFREFKNESEIQGFLEGQMLMRSPFGLSFPGIIASGSNATVLHYMGNDDDFSKDELILLDFGVRWMTMHADISRTVPASGRFDPMQKILYQIVLDAQQAVEKQAKAGVRINDLNDHCWDTVNRLLDERFHDIGGKSELKYEERPHGVSHLIGEQEHDGDPFRDYASKPMRPGWLISNEPGLYGKFSLKMKGKTYKQEIGIRIEDNLLIESGGCQNLSAAIPKTIDQIEKAMRPSKV